MFKGFNKKLYSITFFIFIIILFCLFVLFLFLNYQKNLELKRQISCHELGTDYIYDSQTNSCETVGIVGEKDSEESKHLCNFIVSYTKTERRNVDGLDLELIVELEDKCASGDDIFSKFACYNLELEKKNEHHKTYFNLEGILKTNGDEHLQLIGVELQTIDAKRVLLGYGTEKFERDIKSGEDIPFSITVIVDRGVEEISNFFDKDDEILINTYAVYSSCR